jgi:hypothetical protein
MLPSQTAEGNALAASAGSRRARLFAGVLCAGLLVFAFIGRAVISADDGAEMMADTLGFLVQGRFESATIPPSGPPDPFIPPVPAFRSRYGILPSLVPLPFVGIAWPLRRVLGAAGVDACASLTWAAGAVLAALAFFRLARELRPDVSPLWVPAFLGGTYLWAYAADSYVEPFAAAGLAFAGAQILSNCDRSPARAALSVAAGCLSAYLLRPFDWITAPAFVLAALLAWKGSPEGGRRGAWLLVWLVSGLALHGVLNQLRNGSVTDFGYGFTGQLPFFHPLLSGLVSSAVHPGRGIFLYAPIVIAALLAAPRLGWPARLLCFGVPLELVLVSARWYGWHGGSCWGPRYLVPILPLLVAPAVLAPRRLAAALLVLGALVNLPGVLIAPGAFQSYVELLVPPPGASWPKPGGDRVSEIAALTPLYGHPWLLANSLAGRGLVAPWLARGARETAPPPGAAEYLSPWIVRRATGLPPVSPFLPRLLVRSALGYLVRGRPEEAALFAEEALVLNPKERDAPRILAEARDVLRTTPKGD